MQEAVEHVDAPVEEHLEGIQVDLNADRVEVLLVRLPLAPLNLLKAQHTGGERLEVEVRRVELGPRGDREGST
eukprot:6544964-Alexandrium_andersonii.AAC.1